MNASLPTRHRKVASAVASLALPAILAGCSSQHGGQLLPFHLHSASYPNSGQLVTPPPTNLRRHGHPPRPIQFHRHAPPL